MISHVVLRPVEGQKRVDPTALRDHRQSHQFLDPCCLCPLFMLSRQDFCEVALFVETSGTFCGEYMAKCAKNECGYLGQSVVP
jgi:hypothetical protein